VVWVVGDATINGSETGTSFRQALYFKECGFNLETMIYECTNTGAKGSNYFYWQSFEFMFVMSKGTPKASNRIKDRRNKTAGETKRATPKYDGTNVRHYGNREGVLGEYGIRNNIWRYHSGANGDDRTDHPAPFPEALARDHILSWSNPGDTVLDCFMGSGTTAEACVRTNRNYIGFEINQDYIDLTETRINKLSQKNLFNQ